MKYFFTILIASAVTVFIFSFFRFGGDDVQGSRMDMIFSPFRGAKQSLEAVIRGFGHSDRENLEKYLASAEGYSASAQSLREDKDRFVLIDKITKFRYNFELALAYESKMKENRSEVLALTIRAAVKELFLWSPLYYYLHPEAKEALRPIIKMLEEKRKEMLEELQKIDPGEGGRLAAEDIGAYIKDITKSARRRNSDFISFSLEDYRIYREFFDGLAKTDPQFLFGFAEKGYVLFDDFYAMHKEVDLQYSEKTLRAVNDFRVNLRVLHGSAILELKKVDNPRAYKALEDTIGEIEKSIQMHKDFGVYVLEIMNDDYMFYNKLKDEWNA